MRSIRGIVVLTACLMMPLVQAAPMATTPRVAQVLSARDGKTTVQVLMGAGDVKRHIVFMDADGTVRNSIHDQDVDRAALSNDGYLCVLGGMPGAAPGNAARAITLYCPYGHPLYTNQLADGAVSGLVAVAPGGKWVVAGFTVPGGDGARSETVVLDQKGKTVKCAVVLSLANHIEFPTADGLLVLGIDSVLWLDLATAQVLWTAPVSVGLTGPCPVATSRAGQYMAVLDYVAEFQPSGGVGQYTVRLRVLNAKTGALVGERAAKRADYPGRYGVRFEPAEHGFVVDGLQDLSFPVQEE